MTRSEQKRFAVIMAVLFGGLFAYCAAMDAVNGQPAGDEAHNPQRWRVRSNLGFALLQHGKPMEAIMQFKLCAAFCPKGHAPHQYACVALGTIAEAMGDKAQADKWFAESVRYSEAVRNIKGMLSGELRETRKRSEPDQIGKE